MVRGVRLKGGWLLLGTTAALGGAALGTRVPQDTHVIITRTVAVPDRRVSVLLSRITALELRVEELRRRPVGLDGPEVRALFDGLVPAPSPPDEETSPSTTSSVP